MLYMMLIDGFEETEAVATADVIRRGNVAIKTVGAETEFVTGNHGITVKSDIMLDEVELNDIDGIVLPGGMPGTLNLQKNERIIEIIKYCIDNGKLVAAICAAPMILGEMGILKGKNATCFPGYEDSLEGANCLDEFTVSDGNIITGKGAGAAMLFGAEIVNYFKPDKGNYVLKQVQHV